MIPGLELDLKLALIKIVWTINANISKMLD